MNEETMPDDQAVDMLSTSLDIALVQLQEAEGLLKTVDSLLRSATMQSGVGVGASRQWRADYLDYECKKVLTFEVVKDVGEDTCTEITLQMGGDKGEIH